MNIARFFSNKGRLVGMWNYALVSICFLDSIFHLETIRSSHDRVGLVFDLVFFMIFALLWPLLTIGRLLELQLNYWWIVPMTVPPVIGVVGACYGRPLVTRVALGIAFFALSPLVFLPPRKDLDATQVEGSAGPNP